MLFKKRLALALMLITTQAGLGNAYSGFWIEPDAAHQPKLPQECEGQDFTNTGRPIFLLPRKDIVFGISMAKTVFRQGEEIPLYIWIDNRTDTAFVSSTCGMFALWSPAIWDARGNSVLSKEEMKHHDYGISCSANGLIRVPPHECKKVNAIPMDQAYPLLPGQYKIGERQRTQMSPAPKQRQTPKPTLENSLAITINP